MTSRFIPLTSVVSCLFLASCGYAIEHSYQDFTLLTPGAENAHCFVYVDKVKYQMYPPQTINIMKSENDMEIVCKAPGNRDTTLTVPAELSTRAVWGGPAGVAWDYASKSLHHYPAVVALDFSQEAIKPFPMPKHNSSDIASPESHMLDEISTSQPRLNKDLGQPEMKMMRRDDSTLMEGSEGAVVDKAVSKTSDKGNLESVLERLQTSTPEESIKTEPKPEISTAPVSVQSDTVTPMPESDTLLPVPAVDAPIPLYPGQ